MADRQVLPDLSSAEAALERGDYGQALSVLNPLANAHPLPGQAGAQIRLLMITAWMGQGDETSAIATCRLLSRCQQPEIRSQAKQLLTILESPSLERPERWSMRLPELNVSATGQGLTSGARRRRSRKPPPPPPPPTGPTRGPALGFAALVTAVLLGLTVLLSGCVRIDGDLQIAGPDRVMLRWDVTSLSGQQLPWQQRLAPMLARIIPELPLEQRSSGRQRIGGEILPSRTAASAGVPTPDIRFDLKERNWLVGVRQSLELRFDLSELPEIPGLHIEIQLPRGAQVTSADPNPAMTATGQSTWNLTPGRDHRLALRSWRWSRLGVTSLTVPVLLGLSLTLQSVRRHLGFGFPELPS